MQTKLPINIVKENEQLLGTEPYYKTADGHTLDAYIGKMVYKNQSYTPYVLIETYFMNNYCEVALVEFAEKPFADNVTVIDLWEICILIDNNWVKLAPDMVLWCNQNINNDKT